MGWLKTRCQYFEPIVQKKKTFEIRSIEDRHFNVGDRLSLMEIDLKGAFTGREAWIEITFITSFAQKDNYVVFGFKLNKVKDNKEHIK